MIIDVCPLDLAKRLVNSVRKDTDALIKSIDICSRISAHL